MPFVYLTTMKPTTTNPLRDTRERNNVTSDILNLSKAPSPEGGGKAIYFRGTVDVSRKSNTFDPPLRLFP